MTLIHKNSYFTYNKIYAKTHAKEGFMKYLLGVITVVLIFLLHDSSFTCNFLGLDFGFVGLQS